MFCKNYYKYFVIFLALMTAQQANSSEVSSELQDSIPFLKNARISLDGTSDEKEWASAKAYALSYEIEPRPVFETLWKTEAKIFHDEHNLYVVISAADSEKDKISAANSKRDAIRQNDDAVRILLMSNVGSRRAFSFTVNARGVKADSITSSAGDSAPDWNGEWESAAKITELGYAVEYAIPLSTIGIDTATKKSVSLGINIERRIGRGRNELLSSSPINRLQPCRECQFNTSSLDIDSQPEEKTKKYRLQPFAVASNNQTYNVATGSSTSSESQADMGLDATWSITPRDVIVATLNPDFSQVEIDSIQFRVNERFSRSFAERRAFFTNESGIFRTNMPLVYTRSLVDPNYGLQYVRRRDNYDFGIFYVEDEFTAFTLPSVETSRSIYLPQQSSNTAARLNYRFGQDWSVGGLITSRSSSGYQNTVASVDSTYTINSENEVSAQFARSSTCDPDSLVLPGSERCFGGNSYYLGHTYGTDSVYSDTWLTHTDTGFRADLGSINQVGVTDLGHTTGYIKQFKDHKYLERISVSASYSNQRADEYGLLYQDGLLSVSASTKKNSMSVQVNRSEEFFEGQRFLLTGYNFGLSRKMTAATNLSVIFNSRDAIDFNDLNLGKQYTWAISSSFSPVKEFEGQVSIAKTVFALDSRRLFETAVLTARGEYHFNVNHHLLAIFNIGESSIYQDTSGQISQFDNRSMRYQLTYQYKPSAFRYFIGGISGNGFGNNVVSGIQQQSRYIFTKYVFEF